MTTEERSPERILGYLEASVEDVKIEQREVREDLRGLREDFRSLREEMRDGFAQVNNETRKLYIAALGAGGGIIASLIAVIATLAALILKIN